MGRTGRVPKHALGARLAYPVGNGVPIDVSRRAIMVSQDRISRLAQQIGERLQGASQAPEDIQKGV